jgi:hypothetical protein
MATSMTPADAMDRAITSALSRVYASERVVMAAVGFRAVELTGKGPDSDEWVDALAHLRDTVDDLVDLRVCRCGPRDGCERCATKGGA